MIDPVHIVGQQPSTYKRQERQLAVATFAWSNVPDPSSSSSLESCFQFPNKLLFRQDVLLPAIFVWLRLEDLAFNAWTVSAGEEAAGLNALLMRQARARP